MWWQKVKRAKLPIFRQIVIETRSLPGKASLVRPPTRREVPINGHRRDRWYAYRARSISRAGGNWTSTIASCTTRKLHTAVASVIRRSVAAITLRDIWSMVNARHILNSLLRMRNYPSSAMTLSLLTIYVSSHSAFVSSVIFNWYGNWYGYYGMVTRVRTILVLGYWALDNIHKYWIVLLSGGYFLLFWHPIQYQSDSSHPHASEWLFSSTCDVYSDRCNRLPGHRADMLLFIKHNHHHHHHRILRFFVVIAMLYTSIGTGIGYWYR